MRVVVAHPFPDLYGADRVLLSALAALRSRGDEVVVVVPEPGPLLGRLEDHGVEVRIVAGPVLRKDSLSPGGLVRLGGQAAAGAVRMVALLRRLAPDVLYVNTLTLPLWLGAARSIRVPSVCHVHEAEEQLGRPLALALVTPLLLARAVVANSHATARFLTSHVARLERRVHVVRNGFDFPPAAVPPSRDGRERTIRLVLVGRLNPRKGQHVAIRALHALRQHGRDVSLDLVGSPFRGYEWYERELRELAASLGLAERVNFAGFRDPPWAAYAEADVVLVPSSVESFGNVAVEAMSLARPVVASRVGGLPEVIDDGRTGLLVEPRDPAELARVVASLIDDPDRARDIAAAGAAAVRSRFSQDRFARELLAVLDSVSRGG